MACVHTSAAAHADGGSSHWKISCTRCWQQRCRHAGDLVSAGVARSPGGWAGRISYAGGYLQPSFRKHTLSRGRSEPGHGAQRDHVDYETCRAPHAVGHALSHLSLRKFTHLQKFRAEASPVRVLGRFTLHGGGSCQAGIHRRSCKKCKWSCKVAQARFLSTSEYGKEHVRAGKGSKP